MINSIQQIIRSLKIARHDKLLSQRELSQKVTLPQSQISKIEQGAVDLRLSSLVDLSRALDLELMLVPRKLVPAVQSMTRLARPPDAAMARQQRREAKTLDRLRDTARALERGQPNLQSLRSLQHTAEALKIFRLPADAIERLRRSNRMLQDILRSHLPSLELNSLDLPERQKISAVDEDLKRLHNRLPHQLPIAFEDEKQSLPAYRIDEDEADD